MQVLFSIFLVIVTFSFFSCGPSVVNPVKNVKDTIGETMLRVNKYMVDQDSSLIQKYAERRKITLNVTDQGLFYSVTKTANGEKAKKGQLVSIAYRMELLDGTYCNSSDSTGLLEITLGERKVEVGLEEGLLMLGEGDEAMLILPPHLAHGLTGDGGCIPPRAVLVYTVRLLKISK